MKKNAWVNYDLYPIDDMDNELTKNAIASIHAQLATDGCAVVKNFIRPDALLEMAEETAQLAPKAYFTRAEATVYGGKADNAYPQGHPLNRLLLRENGFVAGDYIEPARGLRNLYHSEHVKGFLATCLGVQTIYEFANPIADLVVNVVKPEERHAWHFDSNEFVITVMTQKPDVGGEFEYAAAIRERGNENFDTIEKVIDGNLAISKKIELNPGDLQIFFGRYSLHRVCATSGLRDRHTAILSYTKNPNTLQDPEKTKMIYGRKVRESDTWNKDFQNEDQLAGG